MIIDRVTAIRVLPPKVTQVPVRLIPHDVVSVYRIGAGERQMAEGATGDMLDVSYEELEIDVYSPQALIACAQSVRP